MKPSHCNADPPSLEARLEQLQSRLRRATRAFDQRIDAAADRLRDATGRAAEALARQRAEPDQRCLQQRVEELIDHQQALAAAWQQQYSNLTQLLRPAARGAGPATDAVPGADPPLDDEIARLGAELQRSQSSATDDADLRDQRDRLLAQLQEQSAANDSLRQSLEALEDEAQELRRELKAAEQRADRAGASPHRSDRETQELDESLQAADEQLVAARQEISELRMQNNDLASQLASVQVQERRGEDHPPESFSWEERKRMILTQLEQEEGDAAELDAPQRDALQDLIARTDRELQRRDAEIAELRALLEHQSGAMGGVAVGAAAIAELIDSDELVQQEREKLQRIQREWEEKLRQAEIDVSLERARLARERMELEEKFTQMREQSVQAPHASTAPTDAATADGKNSHNRRWLTRLGLSDDK